VSERGATPAFSCAELEQVSGELGLGVLGGMERAAALAHLESCPRCRAMVEDAVSVGEHLLELSPDAEPPVGFESRVVARHRATTAPRPRTERRRWIGLGAGLGAAATAAGLFLGFGLSGSQGLGTHQTGTIAAPRASDTRTAVLMSGHHEIGHVVLVAGKPSWVFMTVAMDGPAQAVTCQLVTTAGRHVDLGSFWLSDGYSASWSSVVHLEPSSIEGVQLVTTGGQVVSHARI
jgi:hypothetical protein